MDPSQLRMWQPEALGIDGPRKGQDDGEGKRNPVGEGSSEDASMQACW